MNGKAKYGIVGSLLLFITISNLTFANPVMEDPNQLLIEGIIIFIAFVMLYSVIEFLVPYVYLYKIGKRLSILYWTICGINLFTYPITLYLVSVINYLNPVQIYNLPGIFHLGNLAEIFPIIAEYFLLKFFFVKFYNKGYINRQLTKEEIFLISLGMNMLTYLIGIIFLMVLMI